MRLGGPIFSRVDSPETWVAAVHAAGYRAAYCPVPLGSDAEIIDAYAEAALGADIIIAEVGAWSNPMSLDPEIAMAAIDKCQASLALADQIGARCCVNIAGSIGTKWDGPDAADLTSTTFNRIVTMVRAIIDAVKPAHTFYALETMPWMYPDSPDAYLRLIKAIDREAFAVHLDIVNLVSSPQRYFANADLIAECMEKLGPYIKSCHAKDIILRDNLTVHLDEVRPGLGNLDYPALLKGLNCLDKDIPLMLEHLPDEEEYYAAATYIRKVADQEGITL